MNQIENLRALFGQAEEMKYTIDKNSNEIAEQIRHWCLNEADRLESLRNDICDFIAEHFDVLTSGNLQSGFVCNSYAADYEKYSNGTVSFISRKENNGRRKIQSLAVECPNKNHIGTIYSKLPKPSDRVGWRFDVIRHNAVTGKMGVDIWKDAKLWLAIENEAINFCVDELTKMLEELVNAQKERFNQIAKVCDEILDAPKTVKVVLEIHQ